MTTLCHSPWRSRACPSCDRRQRLISAVGNSSASETTSSEPKHLEFADKARAFFALPILNGGGDSAGLNPQPDHSPPDKQNGEMTHGVGSTPLGMETRTADEEESGALVGDEGEAERVPDEGSKTEASPEGGVEDEQERGRRRDMYKIRSLLLQVLWLGVANPASTALHNSEVQSSFEFFGCRLQRSVSHVVELRQTEGSRVATPAL